MNEDRKIKTLVLIVEMEDGVCYQANLSKRQDTAIKSVLSALDDPIQLIDDPLGMTIEHPEEEVA